MKRTEMVTLKVFTELHKLWPAGHALLALTARY